MNTPYKLVLYKGDRSILVKDLDVTQAAATTLALLEMDSDHITADVPSGIVVSADFVKAVKKSAKSVLAGDAPKKPKKNKHIVIHHVGNDEGGVSAVDRAIIAGEKPAAIAKRFKKTVGAIYVRKSMLKRQGKLGGEETESAPSPATPEAAIDEMRGTGFKPITPETLNKVKDMLAAGEPLEDIASTTGLDFDKVERMAQQLGY